MGNHNPKIVSTINQESISNEYNSKKSKGSSKLYQSDTDESDLTKSNSEKGKLCLKKRSQSLDAGKLTHQRKIGGIRVDKLKKKNRKKSIDSIDSDRRMDRSISENRTVDDDEVENIDVPPNELTEEQKEIIKESWGIVQENVAKVGVIMFMGLFETHPDVKEVFLPFRGIASVELKDSRKLRNHALRVMNFVEKGVSRLEKPEKLNTLVVECGKSHTKYGVPPALIDLVGPQFIMAIQPSLGSRWNDEVESAWKLFFHTLTYTMKKAMSDAQVKGATK